MQKKCIEFKKWGGGGRELSLWQRALKNIWSKSWYIWEKFLVGVLNQHTLWGLKNISSHFRLIRRKTYNLPLKYFINIANGIIKIILLSERVEARLTNEVLHTPWDLQKLLQLARNSTQVWSDTLSYFWIVVQLHRPLKLWE